MAQSRKHRGWTIAGRVVTVLCVGLVGWLVAWRAQTIDWPRVGRALQGYEAGTLALAAVCGVIGYSMYLCYDLLGRAYTRHGLPRRRVAAIAYVVYSFNQNFGAWVGSLAMRYRLYSRYGLKPGVISRIVGMSLTTNWLGYLALGGMIFVLRLAPLPQGWRLGADGLQLVGLLMLGAAFAYLGMCWGSRKRSWNVRGTPVHLPPLHFALTQLMLSMLHWLATSMLLFVLLHGRVPFHQVLAVFMLASMASVIMHIPGGLGVIEAVCVALMTPKLSEATVLAAVFAYRAIYFVVPLMGAMATYAALEHRARGEPRGAAAAH